ncbi:unnamed protein product [Protopolystoma xenopodis]|uniref:Uncharacterized protein n=1 Tax=Protopolystoma xenopodis TaxID=117903 RepID=A0A448WQ89_9PLAT|nr:unnamed protein product [Protopolystoma xenopodis]
MYICANGPEFQLPVHPYLPLHRSPDDDVEICAQPLWNLPSASNESLGNGAIDRSDDYCPRDNKSAASWEDRVADMHDNCIEMLSTRSSITGFPDAFTKDAYVPSITKSNTGLYSQREKANIPGSIHSINQEGRNLEDPLIWLPPSVHKSAKGQLLHWRPSIGLSNEFSGEVLIDSKGIIKDGNSEDIFYTENFNSYTACDTQINLVELEIEEKMTKEDMGGRKVNRGETELGEEIEEVNNMLKKVREAEGAFSASNPLLTRPTSEVDYSQDFSWFPNQSMHCSNKTRPSDVPDDFTETWYRTYRDGNPDVILSKTESREKKIECRQMRNHSKPIRITRECSLRTGLTDRFLERASDLQTVLVKVCCLDYIIKAVNLKCRIL